MRFVLGRESSRAVLASVSVGKEFDNQHRDWLVRFYEHLLRYGSGDLTSTQLGGLMRTLTDTSTPQFSNQDYFLSLMWSEEFFIAREKSKSAT